MKLNHFRLLALFPNEGSLSESSIKELGQDRLIRTGVKIGYIKALTRVGDKGENSYALTEFGKQAYGKEIRAIKAICVLNSAVSLQALNSFLRKIS